MKFEVTAEDIRKGLPTSFFSCPIALAMSRATRKSTGVAWGTKEGDPLRYLMYFKDGSWKFGNFPATLLSWVNDFDRKRPVQAICFEMEIV
jgi:hypothetical protein